MSQGSFWVLISFIKKNVDIHKSKKCKKTLSTNIFFSTKFKTYLRFKICFGPLVLNILQNTCFKERCTKPAGNGKFV